MTSVLVADSVESELRQILEKSGIGVEYLPNISPEDLLAAVRDHEGLVVRSRTRVTKDVIDRGNKLKIIGRPGVDVDTIDVPSATGRGIAVINAPYANIYSVAEYVLAAIQHIYRPLEQLDASTKAGRWEKSSDSRELRGRRVGIVGFGNVGEEVAKRLAGYGVEIVFHDPYTTKSPPYPHVPLDELFAGCDIVTVHTKGAKGIVTQNLLESMPEGAIFINAARHYVLENDALEAALRNRPDLRAAIDVYEVEKAGPKPLAEFGNRVLLTPHIAGSTKEAQTKAAIETGSQIVDYLRTGVAADFANEGITRFPHEVYPSLQTAWAMSYLVSQWNGKPPAAIEVVPSRGLRRHAEALTRAAAIGHQRAGGKPSTWLRAEPYGNVVSGVRERIPVGGSYENFVTVTANPGHAEEEVSAVGSLNSEGVPTLRSLREYSGDESNIYHVNRPMTGQLTLLLHEDAIGAAEVVFRKSRELGLNVLGTSHMVSGSERYALWVLQPKGGNYPNLKDLKTLEITSPSGQRELKVYHAFNLIL